MGFCFNQNLKNRNKDKNIMHFHNIKLALKTKKPTIDLPRNATKHEKSEVYRDHFAAFRENFLSHFVFPNISPI
ncbi:hypothetical protein PGB90_006828 [Kerria lacca]